METIDLKFSQSEFDTLMLELLMSIRLEQTRVRAYLDALVESSMTQKQKQVFKPVFKEKLLIHLPQLAEGQPVLFKEVVRRLIEEINSSGEFKTDV
jgi:hypothetical protein